MIKRLKLMNYKAHQELDMDGIPMLSVLVGKNNTGKSTILHAIAGLRYKWSSDYTLPIGSKDDEYFHSGSSTGIIEIYFDKPGFRRKIIFSKGTVMKSENDGDVSPDWNKRTDGIYYIGAFKTPAAVFQHLKMEKDVGPAGQQTWNSLYHLSVDDNKAFKKISDWASKLNMGISTIETPSYTDPGYGQITLTSHGVKTNLIFNGSGACSALPILVQGVLCEPEDTLLIEEPAVHLHRAAINTLWEFFGELASRRVQVVCTTHSLDFLASMARAMDNKNIPDDSAIFHFWRDDVEKIHVTRRDPKVFGVLGQIIKEDPAGKEISEILEK